MYLTADMLSEKDACNYQVIVFEKEWPDGIKITKKAILRAVELELDINWFAYQFLPAPIWKAYWKAMAPLEKAYNEAIAPILKAYEEAKAPIWEAFLEAIAPAKKAYEEAEALALYVAINSEKMV